MADFYFLIIIYVEIYLSYLVHWTSLLFSLYFEIWYTSKFSKTYVINLLPLTLPKKKNKANIIEITIHNNLTIKYLLFKVIPPNLTENIFSIFINLNLNYIFPL